MNTVFSFLLAAYSLLILSSCGATRKLSDKEYLLVKNRIEVDSGYVNKEDLSKYIRQKPNRKILGFVRFHLWVYNLVDLDKVEARKKELKEKNEKRNLKRAAKDKKPRDPRRSFGEWMLGIGEAPVIFDTILTLNTELQFKTYLKNKGYFNGEVSDTVELKKKKAVVTYFLKPHKPYTVKNIVYNIYNPELSAIISSADLPNTLLKKGMNYDTDVFQKERERITKELKNRGYYFFTTENIIFQADSSAGDHEVELTVLIRSNMERDFGKPDTTIAPKEFKPYTIGTVYVNNEFYPKSISVIPYDTLRYNKYALVYHRKFNIAPKILMNSVFFRNGETYVADNLENTYKQLASLKVYKFINIQFAERSNDKLDCYVQLTPAPRQSFSIETQGTNTGGFPGVFADLVYQNKNVFRGAETFEVRVKGGLESQVVFNAENEKKTPIFNTVQLSPEASLTVPRFLFPGSSKFKVSKYFRPQTKFKLAYDFQQRPDFTRSIFRTTFGYEWRETAQKFWTANPIDLNFVNIYNQSAAFLERINNINDRLLRNTFISHITSSGIYSYIYNNQELNKVKNFTFFRATLELSGNTPWLVSRLARSEKVEGSYRVFNIPFAQFVKFDFDIRRYIAINSRSSFVMRLATGRGTPYGNLSVLPYEASFFGGGANGIRAWKARTLGPGSYPDSLHTTIDQFGDMKLEINLEYRFNIYKYLKMAAFVDAGNIWLIHKDATRPGGEMDIKRFYKEIALGAGLGARLDFNFFIIRLDAAYPIYNPGNPEANNQRWLGVKDPIAMRKVVWNFGIGYPF